MKVALFACVAFLASTALAAPAISSGSCALHCTHPVSFAYETGKSYVYDYSAETSASLLGVAGDDAKMKITSVAHIDVSGPCEYILRLSNVVLEGSSHSAEFAEALSKNPLKFSFQDGMIENICSEVSEPMWVLNIKRGLLSTFQNTMTFHGDETLQEKDVSGVCETDYKSVTEGNIVHVERITNINSCSERPDFSTFITSSSYNTDSLVQNINLLKTTNVCHQKLQDDIMISAECEEIYKARPFGEGQEVAMTKVKTTLVLKSQEPVPGVSDFEFYRKSLVYEDTFEPAPAHLELVEKILDDLITSSHEEVKKETPALFSKLVDALKNLDYSQLSQLLGSTTEPKTHKFLVDAMPLVGTASSMAVVRDLIINGELNDTEKDIWFTSLVFNKHPTVEMLNAIAPLLKTKPSQKAFLGTSALINNFCKLHNTCEEVPVVKEIINNIEIQLGAGCRTTNEEEREKVLVALKALGNAGHWVNAKSVLETCYLEENDMEIRVAALDAWRHTPCEYDRSNILALFQDESYDPELRIAAYLSLMSCPTPSIIDIVKERLISEGVNQVGSFIWTHMTNLQESAAPEKQWMHEMIGEELLQKKFSSDALRFSRNYESSFFMNDLNIGASVESNVIFNTKSYLPRSAMLNLTLDLFGESINFFEIGGRIDGFEAYIERFFGSNGYFPEEHIEQVLRSMRSKSNAESTTLEGFLDKISDEPEGSYYLRVFGNDLHYHHFHGMENLLSSSTSSPLDLLLDLVRQGKVDYTKSFQIMDSHINIPTISGLPLILDSKMTGSFGLEMTSNFQAKSFSDFNVEGHFHPSAALEFDGLMIIDAHLSKTGVKMSTTLHTSTLLDGKVQIQEGKVVDIAINTPKDKIEIFDVQGEFFYLTDDHEEKKEIEGRKVFDGCSSEVLGLAICGFTQVSPVGPFAADIYLKKTGTQTGYIFQFKQQSDKFEFLVDTPGSLEDHKIALTITKAPNSITADIHTPIMSSKGTLEYIWTNLNKKMKCALILDSGDMYAVETSLLKTTEDVTVFEPSIVLTMPHGEILNVQGIVKTKLDYYDTKIFTKLNTVYEIGGHHTFELETEVIKTLTDSLSTYSLHGTIDPSQYPELKASVDMTFTEVEHQQYKTEVKALIKGKTYMFEGKLQDNSVRGKFNVIADASIAAPSLDIKGTLGIYADSEKANTNLHISANGQDYGLKLEGTKSSVLIEANVIRHILLNAYVSESPELKKLHVTGEWNKDVDPTASFLIEGQISETSAMAHVKFLELEATLKCTLLDNGLNLEGIWNGKTATALVSYSLGETKSISVLVHTPFAGLEKQEATVLVTLKNYEINSQFTASWKNSQQITLSVVGKLEPGRTSNALHSEIIFSSSLPHFEHINLKLDHEMKEDSIKTDLLFALDNWKITSGFQLLHNSDGIQSNLSLDTPFTEKILINLNHVLSNNDLTSIIEAKYGEKVASANIKGVVVLGLDQDINLTLKINVPSPSVPEITAVINYKFNWHQLSLDFEGVMQDKKAMFHLNGELSVAESTQLVGDLRFITPFNHPVTATLEHVSNMEELETKFELTRFWSNYGNLKFHAKGNMKSANDIVLLADFFTPSTKASLSLNHKVTDTNMISTLDVHFNAEKITVYLNGLLDVSKSLANLEAIISSTISGLDDLKVTIDTLKNGKDRITKMIFTKMEQSVTIDHIISVTDIWNWENSFTINGMYKLKNVHSYSGTLSKHDMEWLWDTKSVHLNIIFDNKSSGNVNKFDTVVTLETPWTGIEVIKAEVHHEDDGVQYKPIVILEYVPGRKLELETDIAFGKVFSCESILRSPFMETLAYKVKLDLSPRKVAHLMLSLGERHITLDTAGELHNGKMDSSLNIQSTFLSFPVTAAASYDFISSEKNIHLIATYGKKFEITGLLTGSINEGNWSLIADIPLDALQHIELTGKWVYNVSKVNIEINSHVTSFENMAFEVTYDVNEKNGEAKMTYGTKAIHLTGKYEAETIVLEVVTPFNGWEKMKVSLFLSETAIDAFVSKNDQMISVKGSLHVKLEKGTINLSINTPFTGYEEISATIVYSLRGPVKQIKLDSTFSTGQISLLGVIDLSKDLSPTMKLEVTTPFEVVKKIGGEATWDLQHTMKTAVIKAHRNDHHYLWQLEVSSEVLSKVHIKSEIATPFEGWTNVLLEGNADLTKMPYSFKFALDKEGAVHAVEGNFNLENNAITAQLMTPIPGLEVIDLSGAFSWEENHFTGNFEATKSGDKFHLTTDILLNTSKPKLHIILETPIATISKVELVFDSNLVDSHKSLLFTFTLNGTVYSLSFEGEMIHKNGYVKIMTQSPITGFSAVDIHAKYDFTRDLKTAEADFKIEDDSKHFYLKTSVQKNNFHIEIHTPFRGFELIKMIGDYTAQNDKHTVLASFEKDHMKYDYNADVIITDYSVSIGFSTPIEMVKNVVVNLKYELYKNGIESLLHFKRNDENYEIKTRAIFTPMKSELLVGVKTPFANWEKLSLDVKYDILSEMKLASLFIQKGNFEKTIAVEGEYTMNSGAIKLQVPIQGYEVLGASYTLNLKDHNRKLEASLKMYMNSNEWNFSAHGEYAPNKITIMFQTPFDAVKSIIVDGNIEFSQKSGYLNIELGTYKFNVQLSYAVNDIVIQLTTPFDILKLVYFGFTYHWTESQKDATLTVTYNENNYVLQGILNLSPRTSEVTLQATSPVPGFSNVAMMIKYDIDNLNEIIMSKMTTEQYEYFFKLGAGTEGTQAHLNWDFSSTFSGWDHVQFLANVNWSPDQRTLEITLGKGDNLKAIFISGHITGFSEGSLNIHTPFIGMEKMGGYFKLVPGEKLVGKLDLHLPFYLIPKIEGEVNLDLNGKINGDAHLNIAGELYTMKCNLVGSSFEEGYSGSLMIYTPIHELSRIVLNGNIFIKALSSLQTQMKIELPSGVYELDLKGNFALGDSSFLIDLDSTVMNVNRKLTIDTKYPSLNDLEVTLITVLESMTHKIHGKFNVSANHTEGALVIDSPLIEGSRQISFDVTFPSETYQHVSLAVTLVTSAQHSFKLELNLMNGVEFLFRADSPLFEKFSVLCKASTDTAVVTIETPSGMHKIQASWRLTYKMPADYLLSLETSSPLLPSDFVINTLLNGDKSNMIFKTELMVGGERNVIEGSYSLAENAIDFSLNIESPPMNINKATLTAAVAFTSTVKMQITGTFNGEVNIFDLVYEKETRNFNVEITSPFIPTGMARGQGQITGEMLKDMKIKMALLNNEQTISGVVNMKALSQDDIKIDMVITTPFKGYKKMKFGAQYMKDEETKIVFFVDKPVKFNTEVLLKNTEKEVRVFLNVETPIEDLKKIEGEMRIPLNVFAPKISADVVIGGARYGGHFKLRTKAPFEFGAGYKFAEKSHSFHIKTDSSFFSMLA